MRLGAGQLAALVAVVREGSFERAARSLHVTPSAVSQRLKQLEESMGTVLVVRASPCVPTAQGEVVYRHALQVELLERELVAEMRATEGDDAPVSLAIAVNADSLATWFVPALRALTTRTGIRIDLAVDDQDHTVAWLRSGRVLGAVTSQAKPVRGCRVHALGTMRYVATASSKFVRRHFSDGVTAASLQAAPAIAYNRKDDMCARFVERTFGVRDAEVVSHYLPSPHAYLDACMLGLGWGLNPSGLAATPMKRRRLVDLCPGESYAVPLYWQQWAISSATVDAVASALVEHAEATLEAP